MEQRTAGECNPRCHTQQNRTSNRRELTSPRGKNQASPAQPCGHPVNLTIVLSPLSSCRDGRGAGSQPPRCPSSLSKTMFSTFMGRLQTTHLESNPHLTLN
eukprot:3910661-Amphidinium_carterae.1